MLTTLVAAADKLVVAGGSITDKNSALFHPAFRYTHHQKVAGMIFDVTVTVLLMIGWAVISYRNWGPPAKRKLAAAGGVDDADTLQQEGLLLGVEPWIWTIVVWVGLTLVVLGSVFFYS
jgi:hypothetical protein